ncbi:choline transport [Colletotrichum plurivorum]|uniref:Choline transport n=1 Tax=Colletotrichum plurivorum TaxID=2175906 RepID=A0A8H6KX41_9PEZI|nr:choline transport [Colletotrichum plurivorum]
MDDKKKSPAPNVRTSQDHETRSLKPTISLTAGEVVANDAGGIKEKLGPFTLIALCFNLCNTWAGVAASLPIALLQGGPAALLYGEIFSAFTFLCIALSMAEIASVYPSAAGQYAFTSILAPAKINRGISYICGLIVMMSWVAVGAAVLIIPSSQILAIASYFHPEYEKKTWHVFLLYEAMVLLIAAVTTWILHKFKRIHDVGCKVLSDHRESTDISVTVALTMSMFAISFILLASRPNERATHDFVWNTFLNSTGWSDGMCFLVALLTTSFGYAGLDSALHLAEEVQNPRRQVPRAIVLTVIVGFVTAFVYIIVLLYSITDFEELVAVGGYVNLESGLSSCKTT